ncbi:MAG: hemolysin III family protein [Geminicoccaceae bacterium]|nr:MAG: hemolysin III family protein [Geminicoccaceae bacterium]
MVARSCLRLSVTNVPWGAHAHTMVRTTQPLFYSLDVFANSIRARAGAARGATGDFVTPVDQGRDREVHGLVDRQLGLASIEGQGHQPGRPVGREARGVRAPEDGAGLFVAQQIDGPVAALRCGHEGQHAGGGGSAGPVARQVEGNGPRQVEAILQRQEAAGTEPAVIRAADDPGLGFHAQGRSLVGHRATGAGPVCCLFRLTRKNPHRHSPFAHSAPELDPALRDADLGPVQKVRAHPHWVQARVDYVADAALHGLGLAGAVWAASLAWARATAAGDPLVAWALFVYVAGMFVLGAASAACNLSRGLVANRTPLRRLDHASIFIMIAGTYTPFCVLAIGGFWGGVLLGVVWTLCLQGAALRLFGWPKREGVASTLYLAVGWVVVLALVPLIEALPPTGLAWLAAGGVLYSTGVLFYLWDGLPFHRVVWHGFVLAAATCHAVAVFGTVAPAP